MEALLNGMERPLERPSARVDTLRKAGAIGLLVADDLASRCTGAVNETTVDELQTALERMVYTPNYG